jgi:hypothetical protein
MSILTDRDIELLTVLHMSWRRRYFDEVARLLKEDDTDARQNNQGPQNQARPTSGEELL